MRCIDVKWRCVTRWCSFPDKTISPADLLSFNMRARPKIHQIIDHQLQLYLNAHRFAPLCCTYQPSYSFFPFASLDVFRWAAITIFSWSSAAIHLCSNNLAAPLHHFFTTFWSSCIDYSCKIQCRGSPLSRVPYSSHGWLNWLPAAKGNLIIFCQFFFYMEQAGAIIM